jgi:hypothetical protein
MAMTTEIDERDLDDLFAEARSVAPVPSSALLARVEADAVAAQGARARVRPAARRPAGAFARWFAGFGGGPALAGLAGAAVAGVWLGVVQPAPVAGLAGRLSEALGQDGAFDYVELIPSFDALDAEG